MEENTPENKFRAKDDRIFRWCWMPECAIGGVSLALCDGIFLSADSINDDAGNRLSGCQSPTSARLFVDQSRYWIVPDTRNGKKRRLRRRRRRQITDELPWPAWPWVASTASLVLWWRNFSGIGRAGWQGENRCRSSWPFLLLGYDKRQTASENCGRYSRGGSERTSRVGRAGWAEWTDREPRRVVLPAATNGSARNWRALPDDRSDSLLPAVDWSSLIDIGWPRCVDPRRHCAPITTRNHAPRDGAKITSWWTIINFVDTWTLAVTDSYERRLKWYFTLKTYFSFSISLPYFLDWCILPASIANK